MVVQLALSCLNDILDNSPLFQDGVLFIVLQDQVVSSPATDRLKHFCHGRQEESTALIS